MLNKSPRILRCIVFLSLTVAPCLSLANAQLAAPHSPSSHLVVYAPKQASHITVNEIDQAQAAWGTGLVTIGKLAQSNGNYQLAASQLIRQLYAYNYEKGTVLFKPTKAKRNPFRDSFRGALSYFIGGNDNYSEDKGFALQPWTQVTFHNDKFYYHADVAVVMGTYDFTDTAGKVTSVEYTFGYVKKKNGELKIFLQHSSLPYQPST